MSWVTKRFTHFAESLLRYIEVSMSRSSDLPELEKYRVRQSYPRGVGQRRLHAVFPFGAVDLVVAFRNVAAVQGRLERAEIDEKKPTGGCIAAMSGACPKTWT